MNPLIQLKKTTPLILIAALLAGFGLSPKAQAVVPPPDGGYPGGNTAEGIAALRDLTTGTFNTAVGYFSLTLTTGGNLNTGVGASALRNNTTGNENTAVGADALNRNGNGSSNTAVGFRALFHNTTGNTNTAVGWHSLQSARTGKDNTAVGAGALLSNNADGNTAVGAGALLSNNADGNTAVGSAALGSNRTAADNTAVGVHALLFHFIGDFNTAIGTDALLENSTGSSNTAVGTGALGSNTGSGNTALGQGALVFNRLGDNNIAVGVDAGKLTHGSNNIDIGNDGVARDANTIRIGNTQSATYIAGISGQTAGGVAVVIDSDGKLGTLTSSARFKTEIKPMDESSQAVLALKPVTFRYKHEIDPKGIPQFGLVAEDVAEVNPDLVVRDKNSQIYSVRYDAVNAMLLNEFLKEHRKVEKLEAALDALNTRFTKQEAELQKVSALVSATKAPAQVASRN